MGALAHGIIPNSLTTDFERRMFVRMNELEPNANEQVSTPDQAPIEQPAKRRGGRKPAKRCRNGHVLYRSDGRYVPFDAPDTPECAECDRQPDMGMESPEGPNHIPDVPEPPKQTSVELALTKRQLGERRIKEKGTYARSVSAIAFRTGFMAIAELAPDPAKARRAYEQPAKVMLLGPDGWAIHDAMAGDGIAYSIADVLTYYGVELDHPLLVAVANAAICASVMIGVLKE